jgi:hypothetical protein
MNFYIAAVLLALAAAVIGWLWSRRAAEGFKGDGSDGTAAAASSPNALLTLISKLKSINGFLVNPQNWIERIALIGKSPTELARHYIQSQRSNSAA